MNHEKVTSSQIETVGYDLATQTMEVKFTRGGLYKYFDVPPEKHQAFMAAESKGTHLGKHIKGAHRFEKVAPAPVPVHDEAQS